MRVVAEVLTAVLTAFAQGKSRSRQHADDARGAAAGTNGHRMPAPKPVLMPAPAPMSTTLAVDRLIFGQATAPTLSRGGGVTAPGSGIRGGQLLGAFPGARIGPPARAPALPRI
ncbi:hypothetical protein GA0115240_129325 [Streptomyces sp. DvalAA-14]|nr:hypothetical protein GA0115240_129325 [Streptomyces sp. DvalAA-14]